MPEEINHLILSHLDSKSLGRCCLVSKQLNKWASHDGLWKNLFPKVPFPNGTGIKKYIDKHAVTSKDQIAQRIQEFVDKVPLNRKGSFKAICPFNPNCHVYVEIGYGVLDPNQEGLKDICIVMKKLESEGKELESYSYWEKMISPKLYFSVLKLHYELKEKSNITIYDLLLPEHKENDKINAKVMNILANKKRKIEWIKRQHKILDKIEAAGIAAVEGLFGLYLKGVYDGVFKIKN